jgi:hypothetical protein
VVAHVALIGDSIFDNASYTHGLPDVVGHVRQLIAPGHTATLVAQDGSTTADVFEKQLPLLPTDLTHAAVSMGGNDGILHSDLLDAPVGSTADALGAFAQRLALFESSYRRTLHEIVERVPKVAVCTIYTPSFRGPEVDAVRVGLMMLNDVILRTAIEWRLPAIDLRLVITHPADFANELEPSSHAAAKIARSIVSALQLTADDAGRATVFAATD